MPDILIDMLDMLHTAVYCLPMTAFGDLLNILRHEMGLTQVQLAAITGIGRATVSRHESQDKVPDAAARLAYAKAFGMSLAEFDARLGKPRPAEPKRIPLVNAAPAGPTGDFTEWGTTTSDAPETVDAAGIDLPETAFAVRVVGRSMEPRLHDDDIVIFRWVDSQRAHAPIPTDAVVFVRFTQEARDGECMIAQWSMQPNGTIRLKKANPAFESTDWPREAIERVGVLLQLRRRRV